MRSIFYFFLIFFYCSSIPNELKKYPIEKRKIFLENITNQTFEPYVHQELYENLKEKIHLRNSLQLVKNKKEANYTISSSIILFKRESLLYDNEMNPNYYQVEVVVEIQILNKDNISVEKKEIYHSIRYSTKEGFFETDLLARRRLYEQISYKILSNIENIIYENLKYD